MLFILLVACADKGTSAADSGGAPADTSADTAPPFSARDALARYLTGTFDSADQAAENRAYYAVQFQACAAPDTGLGEVVLYIEQALMDDLDAPYRQRLYVLEAGEDSAVTAVSKVYEWGRDTAYIGYCRGAEVTDWGEPSYIEGCDVSLDWDGSGFVGGTAVGTCASALYDEDYTTSEVTLNEAYLESWDRGWYSDGTQVWGAEDGPYHFTRRTAL